MRGWTARSRSYRAMVDSAYALPSMSIQRYEPAAAACSAIRTRWARQTSASWSSPSWVGLTEISPVIPAATILSIASR